MRYYERIGTEGIADYSRFVTFFGFNTYAVQWVFYTTPIVILVLVFLGLAYTWLHRNKISNDLGLLAFFWFGISILRVSFSHTAIYGGVRQIMEYIPAMAILSGLGAAFLVEKLKRYIRIPHARIIFPAMIFFSFIPITLKMISMHPNESIYFNPLIGGLKGASERNIPGWGNSLGSTYRQGVKWLNAHAEPNAKVTTLYGVRSNISDFDLRPDLRFAHFDPRFRSGVNRGGEYVIEVTHQGTAEDTYFRKYLDRYIIPSYQLMVDGVPVLKIWKNDLAHTKPEYAQPEELMESIPFHREGNTILRIDPGKSLRLTRIVFEYDPTSCQGPSREYFEITHGESVASWIRIQGDASAMPLLYNNLITTPSPGVFQYYFAAEPLRHIQIISPDLDSCLVSNTQNVTLYYLK